MMEPRILRIVMPMDLPLLSANDRLHYRERAKRTEKLRSEAYKAAKATPFIPFGKVRIRCLYRAPDNRRRDVANWYPSWKACLDGVVEAGVLKDDNDKYVLEFCMVRGENLKGHNQLILQIIEADDG
jgi:crossover junction endodeoxyribonuclease RusA